ncbi:MAG: ABC transporter ATP-binding protein [Verrucomicrobia bacterium]|jgi:oligopeptide/dipeptide ABC transporter ATP-binding protein|nr:ABC transporter ATP-binding protein [Verrucomicrobiota bacterium]
MQPLLEIKNLSVSFETDDGMLPAVKDVSLSINKGEVLGLVGESGCGKSVTAMSVLRLLPSPPGKIMGGTVRYGDQDLLQIPIDALRSIRGNKISMIFQEPMTALSPLHRIGTQLVEALRMHRTQSKQAAWKEAETWLTKVGIPDAAERMHAYPHQLSGGMRQRVMIAMGLMLDPDLIIADEPTTALDVTIQAQIFDLIREMRKNETAMLLITHDMGVIWEMCTHVAVMYASEIVETGPLEQLFKDPIHPYTKALLAVIPGSATPGERLAAIPGQVASPLDYPKGCHFQDRCRYAFERCQRNHPDLYRHDDRCVRCFLAEENP